MAYKRELIVNNGSLTSYKKILKVSDVCQLLDKREYPATQTTNGVTFTNNGDGSITVNGKIADVSVDTKSFPLNSVGDYIPIDNTHKYLGLTMDDIPSGAYIYVSGLKDNGPYWVQDVGFIGSNGFFYQNKNLNVKYISMSVGIFQTATALYNFNVQPQWFDLTEMYGAGNEPATVEEFKAKFPNDLYDYSPRCWVTSYKTGLIAKTKNLLTEIKPFSNTKVENGIVYQDIADPSELDTLKVQLYNGDTFVKIFGGNAQQIGKNTLTFTTDILPAHTRVIFGLNGVKYDTTVFTPITLENNTTYTLSMDFINITQGEIAWTNSMLEKGRTATGYVPYGYL